MIKRKSANICINIASTLNRLELLEYDPVKGNFIHLDSEECMFDPATREFLDDKEKFSFVIRRLFERNKISLKSYTSLVIPSFFTRQYTVPENVLGDELKLILVSEAERFYVFKKVDPEVGYCPIKGSEILYTAYPQQPLTLIKQAFSNLKIPLVSIDCNYTATLRGLVAMGIVKPEIDSQLKWGMLIVTDLNVFMSVIDGNMIEKTLESPIPVQNTDETTLLGEIRQDFQQFYGYEVLSRIVVVNNSSKISSPTLIEGLQFQGPTDAFDQNENTLTSLGAQDAPFPCSLEAIGGALVNLVDDIPALELGDTKVLETIKDEERRKVISAALIGLGVLLFAAQFGICTLLSNWTTGEEKTNATLQSEINSIISSLTAIPEVKRKLLVKQAMFQNYKFNNMLVKTYQTLPPDAWLRDVLFESDPDLKTFRATVTGATMTSDPLNAYVKEMNTELESAPLLPSITPRQDNSQRYFEYSLTNTAALPKQETP